MRDIIIAGNWKMNKDWAGSREFCSLLAEQLAPAALQGVRVIVAPPFPFLDIARQALEHSPARISAQDISSHTDGAYTGEVSAAMLASLNMPYCIVGHSERRQYHHEDGSLINQKLQRLLEQQIIPILCIGETLQEREAGQTQEILQNQLSEALDALQISQGTDIVIAYEPVWAIGTGRTATAQMAQDAHAFVRSWLSKRFGAEVASQIHILYGGSMKPENIAELIAQEDIDGGLIGGASLKLNDFMAMIHSAIAQKSK